VIGRRACIRERPPANLRDDSCAGARAAISNAALTAERAVDQPRQAACRSCSAAAGQRCPRSPAREADIFGIAVGFEQRFSMTAPLGGFRARQGQEQGGLGCVSGRCALRLARAQQPESFGVDGDCPIATQY